MKRLCLFAITVSLLIAGRAPAQGLKKELWSNKVLKFNYPQGWSVKTDELDSQKLAKGTVIEISGPGQVLCNVTYYQALLDAKKLVEGFSTMLKASLKDRVVGLSIKPAVREQLVGKDSLGIKVRYTLQNVEHQALFLVANDKNVTLTYFHQASKQAATALDGCLLVQTSLRLIEKTPEPPKKTPEAPKK